MNFRDDVFGAFPELQPGHVWLVGAGPGDPRLLSVMAVHVVQSADVIVHDALVNPRVLKLAREGTKIHHAGKRGGKPSPHQRDINELIIAEAKKGLRVVRLKGGDPFVFGRGGEEAMALVREGIPFHVVPGLTSGLAGAALAGIPATTRETNHAIILATGHRAVDDEAGREWEKLAATGQPIILYMAMSHLDDIAAAFLRGGLSPTTPVAILSSISSEGERVLDTELGRAAKDAKEQGIAAPAIIVVGAIAGLRSVLAKGMLKA
jgi:uroporphyrin-III C-methyltransferase